RGGLWSQHEQPRRPHPARSRRPPCRHRGDGCRPLLRGGARGSLGELRSPRRGGHAARRPQRLGQDDAPSHARHVARARPRHDPHRRPRPGHRERRRAQHARVDARRAGRLAEPHRAPQPRADGTALRPHAPRRRRARHRAHRTRRPRRARRSAHPGALAWSEAALEPRPCPRARPARAAARRAGIRARPGGAHRPACAAAAARRGGAHDRRVEPRARRTRRARRPGRVPRRGQLGERRAHRGGPAHRTRMAHPGPRRAGPVSRARRVGHRRRAHPEGTAGSRRADRRRRPRRRAARAARAGRHPGRGVRARRRRPRAHLPRSEQRPRCGSRGSRHRWGGGPMTWLTRMWTVASIELQQRVRGAAWYILLGIFVFVVLVVTVFTTIATANSDAPGAVLYSLIVYFVLLLGTLVVPALSGNAINGDREAGTLATTQVTLVTTLQLVIGKLLAAWITALGFLVAALPFLLFALVLGGASTASAIVSILVLALELGVVSAV